MEIKLRLKDALAANMGFAQCDSVKDVKTRWNIVKNKRLLQAHADDYEELRVNLVIELSPVNKDIGKEEVKVQELFRTKTKELLNSDCPVNGLLPVSKEHLGELPLQAMEAIYPFIIEDEPNKPKKDA